METGLGASKDQLQNYPVSQCAGPGRDLASKETAALRPAQPRSPRPDMPTPASTWRWTGKEGSRHLAALRREAAMRENAEKLGDAQPVQGAMHLFSLMHGARTSRSGSRAQDGGHHRLGGVAKGDTASVRQHEHLQEPSGATWRREAAEDPICKHQEQILRVLTAKRKTSP